MTDQLNISIYREICRCYIDQIRLNIELISDLQTERTLARINYSYEKELKSIEIDGFKCNFADAFEIKLRFDKLLLPKERFYYFKPIKVKIEPVKAQRVYTKRFKTIMPALPKVSVWQQVLFYLKAA